MNLNMDEWKWMDEWMKMNGWMNENEWMNDEHEWMDGCMKEMKHNKSKSVYC